MKSLQLCMPFPTRIRSGDRILAWAIITAVYHRQFCGTYWRTQDGNVFLDEKHECCNLICMTRLCPSFSHSPPKSQNWPLCVARLGGKHSIFVSFVCFCISTQVVLVGADVCPRYRIHVPSLEEPDLA